MTSTIPIENILKQLFLQLSSHFLLTEDEKDCISKQMNAVLITCENNFNSSDIKGFTTLTGNKCASFNPYHSVQYMIFLYYLSHSLYLSKESSFLCDKIYYLNKIFHSVDLFYAIDLPAKFGAEHPLGAVMGRAIYSDGFFFYQGCTVGGTKDNEGNIYYPKMKENVHMFSNSSILGNCNIGKNVNIGAGAIVKNQNIPDNCTVFGQSPNLIIKE